MSDLEKVNHNFPEFFNTIKKGAWVTVRYKFICSGNVIILICLRLLSFQVPSNSKRFETQYQQDDNVEPREGLKF